MNVSLFSLATSGKSLVEELWDYFAENYLSGGVDYPNLGLVGNSILSLPTILIGIAIGAILAAALAIYDNHVIGRFMRLMLEKDAIGREKSLTLYDLGAGERSPFAKALRKSVSLRRMVRCAEEEDFYTELKAAREEHEKKREEDPTLEAFKEKDYVFSGEEHFYIPEDKKIAAWTKYITPTLNPLSIIAIIVGAIVIFFALAFLLPYVLELLDGLIGSFKTV